MTRKEKKMKFTKEFDEYLSQLVEDFAANEVKPYKERIEELETAIGDVESERSNLEDRCCELNDRISECESLLEYIDELEKELYVYQNEHIDIKTVVDELIYKAKAIRGNE